MHVPNGEKDADALPRRGIELFVHDFDDVPVRRRHHDTGSEGIAAPDREKIKDKQAQEKEDSRGPLPAEAQAEHSQHQRRSRKPVGIFNHSWLFSEMRIREARGAAGPG